MLGEKIPDLIIYERISQFSIWIALALAIGGILLDQKIGKRVLFIMTLFPIMAWGYLQFVVDYSRLKKDIFSYTGDKKVRKKTKFTNKNNNPFKKLMSLNLK